MKKLLLRFFSICVVFTILVFLLLLYIYKIIDEKNTLENIKLITQGKFQSLDEYLQRYPHQEWQKILKTLQPRNAGYINIVPISQLSLSPQNINDILNNKIVYTLHEDDPSHPVVVYKRISHSHFVYQDFIEFNDTEKAHQYFGWVPFLIMEKLHSVPSTHWSQTLKKLSKQYGYPISINKIEDLGLKKSQYDRLKINEWVVDMPNNHDDSIQTLYVPLSKNKILMIGPIHLPFYGVYQKYIIFVFGFIMIELIIFILGIMFSRTLNKLNILADNYGKGIFDNHLKISKTSTLYPLFINLKNMGNNLKKLIGSHKELTNAVSHELRTPLSRLRFSLYNLLSSNDIKKIHEHAQGMEDDIHELENLVTEILSYASLDRTDLKMQLNNISLNKLLDVAIKKLQPLNNKKRILVNYGTATPVLIIYANEKYFLRAIENILRNAYRFAHSTVKVDMMQLKQQIQVVIEDDGPGIPDAETEHVFKPFFQLENSKTENNGFGLGLAIAKKVIDQHQWSISITKSVLGGAKISIHIPV